jgi:multiple sugar transport system ATP-binding protein
MANVQMRGVVKEFGGTPVLKGVDFAIHDGEFLSLIGPSGCGKSTLLRMIAGLEVITDGEIEIGGKVVNRLAAKDRDIAMVFQNYALYPHMTVRENMSFALEMRDEGKAQIASRVAQAASILGLEALLDRFPRQLSGGQQQRVAMGRAIVRQPKVFLFDEPLSNLDAQLRVQMRTEIKDLHERLQTTTVYVTHDQIEAMTMADRIVVMRAGAVEQIGTPLELYDRPANTFVAGFIGSPSMNLVAGELTSTGQGLSLTLADGQQLALTGAAALAPTSRRVKLGVRPEHFLISPTGLNATVTVVEPTGSETQVAADLAGQRITVLIRDRVDLARGQSIKLLPQPDRLHLFDAESGLRLDWVPAPLN